MSSATEAAIVSVVVGGSVAAVAAARFALGAASIVRMIGRAANATPMSVGAVDRRTMGWAM